MGEPEPFREQDRATGYGRKDAMLKHLKMFMQDEDGASAAEYALLIGLIAAAIILTVQGLGTTLDGVFENFDNQLSSVVSPSS